MRFTPNFIPPEPVKPILQDITVTLSPREAFMLMAYFGQTNTEGRLAILKKTVHQYPELNGSEEFSSNVNVNDSHSLGGIFHKVYEILNK